MKQYITADRIREKRLAMAYRIEDIEKARAEFERQKLIAMSWNFAGLVFLLGLCFIGYG